MELTELLETLKDTTATLEDFINSTESKSGEKYAEEYVKENRLEYISDEVKKAFKAGFIYRGRQEKAGMFEK